MRVVQRVYDDDSVSYLDPWAIVDVMGTISEEELNKKKHLVAAAILVNDVASKDKADPAFRYAMSKYQMLLRPTNQWFTKNMC